MPSPRTNPSRRTFLAGLAGVAIVGVSTGGAILFTRDDDAVASAPATTSAAASTAAPSTAAASTPAASSASATSSESAATSAQTSSATSPTTASASSSSSESATSSVTTSSSAAAASTYKDGKYTESGDYDSPAGTESVTVTVTLAADVVTATTATGSATSGPSSEYQQQFLAAYSTEVVGKDIDSVSLSRVSGSSLTSNGFNAALTKIKSDAKA